MDATTPLAVLLRGHGLCIGSPKHPVCTLATLFTHLASNDVSMGVVVAIAVVRRGIIVSQLPVADVFAAAVAWGADVHADNDDALRYAASHGYTPVVEILLDAGANVHAEDDAALYYAALGGQYKVVELLLNRGAGNIGKALIVAKHGIVKRLLADEAHRLPVFRALTAM